MEKLRKIGFSKLTKLEDALEQLYSHINLNPVEEIEISDSLNRILASNIISDLNIPPFDRSAMDGYAIIAEDSFGASPKSPREIKLIGVIEIGETSNLRLNKGEGIRISTGAPIPEGANSVIKIEDTEIDNESISLYTSIVPGKNISKQGEDFKIGTQVLNQGVEIKAEHIALLSSLGLKKARVRAKTLVSVFASGDELIEPGNPLEAGKIYNSNTLMISNLVKLYGGQIVRGETLKDDKQAIKTSLIEASMDSQVIIFTGGTSVGSKDFLPEIVTETGTILTHGIAMRPGSPILIGMLNKSLIFCLPGTPVAAYICFLKIAGIAIRKMQGCINLDPRLELIATVNKDVPVSYLGFIHHLRVKLKKTKDKFIALPVRLKGSGVISTLTESDGIVEISSFQEGLKKGDQIQVRMHPK